MIQLLFDVDGRLQIYTLLKSEVTLGRSSDSDVVLNDFSVSRRHAMILLRDQNWIIRDNNSTNGVRVNGKAVTEAAIGDGDQVVVGAFVLRVRDDPTISDSPDDSSEESSSTFIRSLADFNQDFHIDNGTPVPTDNTTMRKRGELDVAYKNRIFEILIQVARTLISSDDLALVLENVMDLIFEYLPVDRGFLLLNDKDDQLETRVARVKPGRATGSGGDSDVPFPRTIVEMVMRQKVALLTSDAQSDRRFDAGESIVMQQVRSAMCVPLWIGESVIGVIYVDSPVHVGTFKSKDLDLLTALANFAAVAIERARLHGRVEEGQRIRARLARYHSPAVVEEIIRDRSATGSLERARTKEVSVLFADLVGFTSLSERMAPDTVAALLNGFFTLAADAVFSLDGTLDKFIGDEAMAFFGAPIDQTDHAWRAVQAALKIRETVQAWNQERVEAGEKPIEIRIAVNSGEVIVGEIGSDRRVDYTVLGTPVNIAARIEEQATMPGDIVVGPQTYEAIKGRVRALQMGYFALKGLAAEVPLYKILGALDTESSKRPTLSSSESDTTSG